MTALKQALVVIDVQQALFDGPARVFEATEVLARINGMSQRARALGVPVIFVQHEDEEMQFGNAAWQLHRDLERKQDDHFVRKATPDSFLRTRLGEVLETQGVRELVICGLHTQYCVDTTTRRAMALGFPVVLVADAHSTSDQPYASAAVVRAHHNATLSSIESFGPRTRLALAQDLFQP